MSVVMFRISVERIYSFERAGWQRSIRTSSQQQAINDRLCFLLTSWVRVDLPKLMHGLTAKQEAKNQEKVCDSKEGISSKDFWAVAMNTVLQANSTSQYALDHLRQIKEPTVKRE